MRCRAPTGRSKGWDALLLSASDPVATTLPTAGPLAVAVGVVTGALGGICLAWLLGRGQRR
ncbi:hypothetical protein [Streptomyces sp. NPDC059611]|uniref:hypothetical protein n=1 Tax=Streptomyces sp. NPDC059611 TaxID=3346884 RepID=UPI00367CC839